MTIFLKSQIIFKESERQKLENEKLEAERQWIETVSRLEADKIQKELERERQRKEFFLEETIKKRKKALKAELERKLRKYMPRITEINLIAKEMQRRINLSVKLEYSFSITYEEKPRIMIEISNIEEKSIYCWSLAKFRNRYYLIKELFDK